MSSMGYVMMNWSSLLIKQSKKKKRKEMLNKGQELKKIVEGGVQTQDDSAAVVAAAEILPCEDCVGFRIRISELEAQLEDLQTQQEEIRSKLDDSKTTLASTMERESKLRSDYEDLVLQEAQVRYELDEQKKRLTEELEKRDNEHEQQVQIMEQLMGQKDQDWAARNEVLQQDLRNALRTNYEQTNVEHMTRQQLEQELASLQTVIDLRMKEIHGMRTMNADLNKRLERQYWMESELGKARQRVEEMNLVVQNKMVAEKELIDMTESLTNNLSNARNEILSLRREIENRQYLLQHQHQHQQQPRGGFDPYGSGGSSNYNSASSGAESPSLVDQQLNKHRNQHQKASSGGNSNRKQSDFGLPGGKIGTDPTLIVDVREKSEAVAWMLHIPDGSPKVAKRIGYS